MTSAQPNSVREGVDIALRLGPSLATGRLEAILPDYALPCTPPSMLIVPERAGIARVRLLGDFLATQICRFPGIKRQRPMPRGVRSRGR
jgi:hypothetical protein